jgi:hypothetical protein
MNDHEKIEVILLLRSELNEAEALKCDCTGFGVQYDGHTCERSKRIKEVKEKIISFVKNI